MLTSDTLKSRILDTLIGAIIFFIIVAGSTYYLQSSLVVYKHYGAHNHWAAILIGAPLIAGLIMRLAKLIYPLISAVLGALASASFLYPFYKGFWAVPPTLFDLVIYIAVVLGIGFIATQPLRTTFMIAFRIGRYAVPKLKTTDKKPARKSPKTKSQRASTSKTKSQRQPSSMTKTQRLQSSDSGNVIALLELMVGLTSLVLSIVSIFFLGRS